MRLTDKIKRWWKPAQWNDDHPDEQPYKELDTDDSFMHSQHGIGAESYDRIDVEQDFKKP